MNKLTARIILFVLAELAAYLFFATDIASNIQGEITDAVAIEALLHALYWTLGLNLSCLVSVYLFKKAF
jgi:hypothetical protein